MKRFPENAFPILTKVVQRKTFFYGMASFLLLPFMPVQFTSILTAVVWIFSGTAYALVFVVLGTFGIDSIPIYSGLDRLFAMLLPGSPSYLMGWLAIAFMFSGNLMAAYLFRLALSSKFTRRFRLVSLPRSQPSLTAVSNAKAADAS